MLILNVLQSTPHQPALPCVALPTGKFLGRCAAGVDTNRSVGRMAFPLSNETEVEEREEQDGIDNGTESGELGCLDEASAKDRYWNAV